MAEYTSLGDFFGAVANAIREKKGTTDKIKPINFPEEIASIESGSGGSDTVDTLLNKTITSIISDANTTILANLCINCELLKTVELPNVTSVGGSAFYHCSSLETVNLNSVEKFTGSGVFAECALLKTISVPKLMTLTSQDHFKGCASLEKIVLPLLTTISERCFADCTSLKIIDCGSKVAISMLAFNNCTSLRALILRGNSMSTYDDSISPFKGTSDLYIYVPSNLIATYKADSTWKTHSSQFRVLEDYTVDGTTTGELDTSKI